MRSGLGLSFVIKYNEVSAVLLHTKKSSSAFWEGFLKGVLGNTGAKIVQGERRAKEKPQDLLLHCRAAAYLGEAEIVQVERSAREKPQDLLLHCRDA